MLGAIGTKLYMDTVIFEVSDKKIYTVSNFKRTNKMNFAKNNVLQKKPISEYVGQELDTISFDIVLRVEFGIDPRTEFDKLIRIQRDGVVITLVIGGKGFGTYRWIITGLDLKFENIDAIGYCTAISCSINLEEYAQKWEVV